MTNACRHFTRLGLIQNKPACALGWDVRKWAAKCNGGSEHGILKRLPCTAQTGEKPLFDCPSVDRETDEEVEAQRLAMKEAVDKFVATMPKLDAMRKKMIANDLSSAKATCPWCDAKDALRVTCAIGYNNHLRASCVECGKGFIE